MFEENGSAWELQPAGEQHVYSVIGRLVDSLQRYSQNTRNTYPLTNDTIFLLISGKYCDVAQIPLNILGYFLKASITT